MELGHTVVVLQSLILISAANGAPVVSARMLGRRFADPIDGGVVLRDGYPLLGRSKTWRGSPQLSFSQPALQSSSVSHGRQVRSSGLPPWRAIASRPSSNGDWARTEQHGTWSRSGSRIALPAVASGVFLPLALGDIVAIVLVFSLGELAVSRLLYAVGLRDRPY